MLTLTSETRAGVVPVTPVFADAWTDWVAAQTDPVRAWIDATGYAGAAGTACLLPGADGTLARVLWGLPGVDELWDWAGLPGSLPPGTYVLDMPADPARAERAALAWALAGYRFGRYKADDDTKPARVPPELAWPDGCDRAAVIRAAEATFLVRDLINTPAEDMGPAQLADAARELADRHGGACRAITGDDLLDRNYPAIHAVGRASVHAPRLIDLTWEGSTDPAAPRVTLIGKGVCFDTGGLDLKQAAGMKLMKKDMGGAAHALGVVSMVMAARLALNLRVLIPAVENSVAGNAIRPLDVVRTRKGLTIEIGNTDAEGRVILADALAEAMAQGPDLVIDFATLTGAARVALGTDLPALFCNDEALAEGLLAAGAQAADPLWRMPLWQPYAKQVEGKVADLTNAPEGGFGGAITAALFLEAFTERTVPWAHIDLMGWNTITRPGRPEGGEAMGLRAVFAHLAAVAGQKT